MEGGSFRKNCLKSWNPNWYENGIESATPTFFQDMDAILTQRAIISLGISSLHFTAAILLTFLAGWLKKIPFSELLIVLWLFYDAIIHFTLVSVVYLKWVWYLYILL